MAITDTTAGPWGPMQTPKEQPKKTTGCMFLPLPNDEPEEDDNVFSSTTN